MTKGEFLEATKDFSNDTEIRVVEPNDADGHYGVRNNCTVHDDELGILLELENYEHF
jgi:hypothetical protein